MFYVIGITMLLGAIVAIICGYMAHWKRIVEDIIEEEKRKVWSEADAEIEARAEERAREILSSIRYTKRVELVNESDINWGERKHG
jgi:hypothetical protein